MPAEASSRRRPGPRIGSGVGAGVLIGVSQRRVVVGVGLRGRRVLRARWRPRAASRRRARSRSSCSVRASWWLLRFERGHDGPSDRLPLLAAEPIPRAAQIRRGRRPRAVGRARLPRRRRGLGRRGTDHLARTVHRGCASSGLAACAAERPDGLPRTAADGAPDTADPVHPEWRAGGRPRRRADGRRGAHARPRSRRPGCRCGASGAPPESPAVQAFHPAGTLVLEVVEADGQAPRLWGSSSWWRISMPRRRARRPARRRAGRCPARSQDRHGAPRGRAAVPLALMTPRADRNLGAPASVVTRRCADRSSPSSSPLLAAAPPPRAPLRVDGRGWGHGIGLSQYGAYGYALRRGPRPRLDPAALLPGHARWRAAAPAPCACA